jgi:MYXO-CTERM domain-containing protein
MAPVRLTVVLAVVTATAAPAAADWPMARHDARRTGLAAGTSDLVNPAPYWRQYLGGALGTGQVIPLTDGDVAYVGGGRLRALSLEGTPRWHSDNLELTGLVGDADLDGDGTREVIARSGDRAFVFARATGALLWAEPIGEMGTLADVRLADVDGRPGAELIVQECFCCALRSGTPGFVYTFADGFAAPRRLWALPSSACGGARQMQVADFTGDGAPEFVLATQNDLRLLDGATGVQVAVSDDLGPWTTAAYCEAAELLPGTGLELACWQGSVLTNPGSGHRVMVFRYRTGPARLERVWTTDVGDRDGDFVMGSDRIGDLDGDGALELIATGTAANGEPVTTILDAATGAVLATVPGQQQVAILTPTAEVALLVTQASQQLLGWRFDRDGAVRMTLAWRLKDRRILPTRDPALAGRLPLAVRPILIDVNGDGALDLATVDTKRPNELLVYDARQPADLTLRSWRAAPDAEVLAAWRAGDALVVSTSDGRVTTLALPALTSRGSFRAGQYYDPGAWQHQAQAPVAGQLTGDAAHEVVVADSRRTLAAFDARNATNAAPPLRLWELRGTVAPNIVPDLGGSPGLVCRRRDDGAVPAVESLARLDGLGAIRWEVPIGGDAWNDVVTGNLDGDGVPDLIVQWGRASDAVIRTTALAGTDGRHLWTTDLNPGPAKFPSGVAVTDWNGDGRDDVIYHHYRTYVMSGVDGAVLASANPPGAVTTYLQPTVVNLDSDPGAELVLSGGFMPLRAVDHDLVTNLFTDTDDRPYPYVGLVRCDSRWHAVATSLRPGLVKVIDPAAGRVVRSVVLAGGQLFTDASAAETAAAKLGVLASPLVHGDLTGRGRPSAVIGSSDGWLYAIDPCAGALDFAVPFGAPVGATAVADTDADGKDELLVSVADGYLYGLKHAPIRGPGVVRDLDPRTGSGDDVDEIDSRDTLSASWDPVPGATGYEVAIAHAEGGYVVYPPWQRVDATSFTRTGVPLVDGQRYVIAVRALSDGGRSPDILSDGVLVHLAPAGVDAGPGASPDAGDPLPGTPGGCCSTGAAPTASLALTAVVAALLGRRRRRVSSASARAGG